MANRPKKSKISPGQIADAEEQIVDRSKRIDFFTTEYTVELLAGKMERGDFVIPSYQREFTWENSRKSKFIESLIIGLPIPFLFFWEMGSGKLEIVDGSQRLRTIHEYLNDNLELIKLEQLTKLNHTKFSDLPPSRQLKVKNRSIRGIVLNEHADDQARFDMFERINTGSKQANTAEVRRGALRGPFLDLVLELAAEPRFSALAPVSGKSEKERIPEELVTRFFAYGDGLEEYKEQPAQFMFNYTKKMNSKFIENPALVDEYRSRFFRMIDFCEIAFPGGFSKPSNPNTTPRARFEALAIGSHLAITQAPALQVVPEIVTSWLNGAEFTKITTSDAANVKSKLIKRIEFVRNKLLENQP